MGWFATTQLGIALLALDRVRESRDNTIERGDGAGTIRPISMAMPSAPCRQERRCVHQRTQVNRVLSIPYQENSAWAPMVTCATPSKSDRSRPSRCRFRG